MSSLAKLASKNPKLRKLITSALLKEVLAYRKKQSNRVEQRRERLLKWTRYLVKPKNFAEYRDWLFIFGDKLNKKDLLDILNKISNMRPNQIESFLKRIETAMAKAKYKYKNFPSD